MKTSPLILHLALLLLACPWQIRAHRIEVAPSTNRQTLRDALDVVRAKRSSGEWNPTNTVTLALEAGKYRLAQRLELTALDSHMRFVGKGAGTTTLTDLRELPSFAADSAKLWHVDVGEGTRFEQLFVNGIRATRATSPNSGYFYMREKAGEMANPCSGKVEDMSRRAFFGYHPDLEQVASLPSDEIREVAVRVFESWSVVDAKLDFVDRESGLVVNRPRSGWRYFNWCEYEPRYRLENFRGALDAPGEWFLDTKRGRLWYVPRQGERLETTRAEVPSLDCLVVVSGSEDSPICDVEFSDLGFEGGAWEMPSAVSHDQAAAAAPETVRVAHARDVAFNRVCVRNTAGYALHFKANVEKAAVLRSLFENLGAGGVRMTGSPRLPISNVSVADSIIRGCGRLFPEGIGVWMCHARDCIVEHNDIGDLFYTGVSLGWTWGYKPTCVRNNRIAFNRIHHVGQRVLSDLAGIYTLGDCTGTVVEGNWISDVQGYNRTGYGAHGLYTDEGSAGILFVSNLVVRTGTPGLHQHYGRENRFENNVFYGSDEAAVLRSRNEPHLCFSAEHNIFSSWRPGERAIVGKREDGEPVTNMLFRNNLWHAPGGLATNAFLGASWDQWREWGQDEGSRVADPLFVDPAHDDFRIRPDSPSLQIGFVPFDPCEAGVRGDVGWQRVARDWLWPHDRSVQEPRRYLTHRLSVGFEIPSSTEGGLNEPESNGVHRVRGGAFSGDWSLRMHHTRQLARDWYPHVYLRVVTVPQGCHRFSFAFLLEDASCSFDCEWRGLNGPRSKRFAHYDVGPVARFGRSQLSFGSGNPIALSVVTWYRCEMELRYLADGSRHVVVRVSAGGVEVGRLEEVVQGQGMSPVNWIGFISRCAKSAECAYRLDDILFEAGPDAERPLCATAGRQ